MKKTSHRLGFVLIGLGFFLGGLLHARDWNITVPRSGLVLPTSPFEVVRKESRVELGFSSWAPSELTEASNIPGATVFRPSHQSPRVSLNLEQDLVNFDFLDLNSLFGFSFLPLERTGLLNYQNTSVPLRQDLTIYQFRAGLVVHFLPFLTEGLRPLIAGALTPSLRQSPSSEFNKGVSSWEWVIESQAGLEYHLLPEAYIKGGVEFSKGFSSQRLNGQGLWISTELSL